MSTRTVSIIGWTVCVFSFALTAMSLLLLTLNFLEPAAEGQPRRLGAPRRARQQQALRGRLLGHQDSFATTRPWREGSELGNKIDALLSERPSRVEMEVAYLNAPQSL